MATTIGIGKAIETAIETITHLGRWAIGRRRAGAGSTPIVLAMLVAIVLAGCRDRGGAGGKDEERHEVIGGGAPVVEVQLLVPKNVAWNYDDTVRVTVVNRTPQALDGAVLNLFFQSPLEARVDSAAADSARPETTSSGEGTRLAFRLPRIEAGRRFALSQGVRTPPAGLEKVSKEYDGRRSFLVRAWVARGSTPEGATAQDTVTIRPGAETVAGGCAAAGGVVTRHGVGPVRVGMTADALRDACPEARDTAWPGQEGMEERGLAVAPGGSPAVALLAGDTVARILVAQPGLKTAAGMGVGATVGDLRERYGRMCAGLGEGRVAVWFPNAPGISFGLDTTATRGWTPARAQPDSIPDEVAVGSFWVRRGSDECPAGPGEGGGR